MEVESANSGLQEAQVESAAARSIKHRLRPTGRMAIFRVQTLHPRTLWPRLQFLHLDTEGIMSQTAFELARKLDSSSKLLCRNWTEWDHIMLRSSWFWHTVKRQSKACTTSNRVTSEQIWSNNHCISLDHHNCTHIQLWLKVKGAPLQVQIKMHITPLINEPTNWSIPLLTDQHTDASISCSFFLNYNV